MTTSEMLKKECEQIMQRTGYYIRPNRMPDIMKAAQKATDAITNTLGFPTFVEIMIVLRIIQGAIKEATGEDDEACTE